MLPLRLRWHALLASLVAVCRQHQDKHATSKLFITGLKGHTAEVILFFKRCRMGYFELLSECSQH